MNVEVGDRVLARDAFNRLRRGWVQPVPPELNDGHHNGWTRLGDFPKCWVRFEETGNTVPWPIEDVFTDEVAAQEAVDAHLPDAPMTPNITITPLGRQLSPRARARLVREETTP